MSSLYLWVYREDRKQGILPFLAQWKERAKVRLGMMPTIYLLSQTDLDAVDGQTTRQGERVYLAGLQLRASSLLQPGHFRMGI